MAQTNLGSLGTLDWGEWASGLVSAFVSGGASAAVAAFTVTATNPSKDLSILPTVGTTFVVGGVVGMLNFLRTKSRPDYKTVVTTTETVHTPSTSPPPSLGLESSKAPDGSISATMGASPGMIKVTRVESYTEDLKKKE